MTAWYGNSMRHFQKIDTEKNKLLLKTITQEKDTLNWSQCIGQSLLMYMMLLFAPTQFSSIDCYFAQNCTKWYTDSKNVNQNITTPKIYMHISGSKS